MLKSMKIVAAIAVAAFVLVASPVKATAQSDSPAAGTAGAAPTWWQESMTTRDQRLRWWREARFGMFLHWGVYSGLGGTWQDRPVRGYAEHIQRMLKIPIPVYREQVAGKFNPSEFNADEWARMAKEAGMGYMIITAKHHDGFAMWDSQASDYNIVKATPFKRDPMKELKVACAKQGIKFGFYYSHAFDWGDADAPGNDWDYDNPGGDRLLHGGRNWWDASPEFLPKVRKYVDGKSLPQLHELIAGYQPDILWFDTPHKLPDAENLRIMQQVRAAAPNVVINGRLVRGKGDYDSTTDRPAEFVPHEGDWEGIPTTNESYGYNQNDHSHKPAAHFIRLLAKAAARGGNMLMNIGPMGNGKFDPTDVAILEGIGKWMKLNGESIHGTDRTPLAVQAWGESTRKDNTFYLHVFDWPKGGKIVVGGLEGSASKAYLLADATRTPLKTARINDLDLLIEGPAAAPDAVDSVVAVEMAGDIATDHSRLLSTAVPSNRLHVFDGELHGRGLRYGPGKKDSDYVATWPDSQGFVAWPVRVNESAEFEVKLLYDADAGAAGSAYAVTVGTQRFEGTAKEGKNQAVSLGKVTLPPGVYQLRVAPKQMQQRFILLRGVELGSD